VTIIGDKNTVNNRRDVVSIFCGIAILPQIRPNAPDKHSAGENAATTHDIATFCATRSFVLGIIIVMFF